MSLIINIHGADDSFWCVHGPGAGEDGVTLSENGVIGMRDAFVRTSWQSGARQIGGSMKGMWYETRDWKLMFNVTSQLGVGLDQENVESRLRQAFTFREDEWDHDAHLARIEVIGASGSARTCEAQLYEAIDDNPRLDSMVTRYSEPIFPLRSGMPFWSEPDVVSTFFATSAGPGTIEVENPTNLPMYQKWILTRGDWALPDFSWSGPPGNRAPGVSKLTGRDDSNRWIIMPPIGPVQGGATVDLDPQKLMVRDLHGTNLLGQMPVPGMFFEYVIPPYTQRQSLPISVSNVPVGGAMAQLVQQRRWTEPYGLQKW